MSQFGERGPILARAGTNLGGASAHNRRVVIDALRHNGTLSRADLARSTRLTPQTVSNIVQELQKAGLVAAGAPVKLARGQPAVPYHLVPDGAFALGLHIDRHYARVVAVNLMGETLLHESAPLPAEGPEAGIPVVLRLLGGVRELLNASAADADARIVGVGIAMPGPFGVVRDREDQWMMARWHAHPVADTIAEATGLKVRLLNDATAAMIAEKLAGAAHGFDDLVCIFLGYGLGAGILVGGDIYEGANGNAGEIGEILIRVPGTSPVDPSTARTPTPIEHDASLASLARLLGVAPSDPSLFDAIDSALERSDPGLDEWIAIAAQQLRRAVQIVESLFDPQTVVLGGQAPVDLLKRLHAEMQPLLPSVSDRPDRVRERVILGGGDRWAVARGAATEPISREFDPRFSAILKPGNG